MASSALPARLGAWLISIHDWVGLNWWNIARTLAGADFVRRGVRGPNWK